MCITGLAALAKVIIAMEDGFIPANLHYKDPNPDIPSLTDGRIRVVSERTSWSGGYVGVNSFGFGGSNVHVLLKSQPRDAIRITHPASATPRLATFAGRTKESVETVLKELQDHADDVSMQALLQANAAASTNTHSYRGYVLLNKENQKSEIQVSRIDRSAQISCANGRFYVTHKVFNNI